MRESRESVLSELNKKPLEINTNKVLEDERSEQSVKSNGIKQAKPDMAPEIKAKGKNAKKKRDIKEVRTGIKNGMPELLRDAERDLELAEVNDKPTLEDIERILDEAAADTGRAALYYKVRDAIKLYRETQDDEAKMRMLLAVRESAFNYLLEKSGSAPERKRICKSIVRMVDAYAEENEISTERNLDYLLGDEKISDKVLDMEILLAGKLTKKSSDPFEGNLADRRKAFKRKIKDVKLARTK